MSNLSDLDLENFVEFKKELADEENLDQLLPEAYAVVREADKRILGLFPLRCPSHGSNCPPRGNIAEMATGEGKTLTATMPLYLNALSGQGAMLVLLIPIWLLRDAENRSCLPFLGLTIETAVRADETKPLETKRKT